MSTTTKENNYTNHKGVNKEKARIKMSNFAIDSGVVGNIISLPNEDWFIEKKINRQTAGNTFTGVECNKPTYNKMRATLRKTKGLKAETYFGYIKDLIFGKGEDTYAHMILDYCGTLSTFSKEIEYAINNNVVKLRGTIAITFGKPLRGTDAQAEKIKNLAPINNEDLRCMSDRAVESYFAKITGWNYQVTEIFYYTDKKDKGKGYPMVLVLIKRIK